jgi:hypothetical protein
VSQTVIQIPTLNDSKEDFEGLFEIWSQTNGFYRNIRFDFSQCNFLRPNAVAFIGGMARQIQSRAGSVVFDWESFTNEKVLKNLIKNRFAALFFYPVDSWTGNTIPYREDRVQDENSIMDYLTDEWIGCGWIQVSNRLKNAVVGRMWEIYCNAFEHAGSGIGVFSCGQYFPNVNQLILSVVDFGHGIAANVRNFFKFDPRANQLTAAQCLKWAFGPGHTTRPNGMARGIGLDVLKEFIKVNHGKMEVYSNEGCASIDHSNEIFTNRESFFEGTIFHITLICDEKRYQFADEI